MRSISARDRPSSEETPDRECVPDGYRRSSVVPVADDGSIKYRAEKNSGGGFESAGKEEGRAVC